MTRPDIRSDIAAPVILDMAICNKPELRLRHRTVSYHSCQRTAESDGVKPMDSAECGCVFRSALELLTFQVPEVQTTSHCGCNPAVFTRSPGLVKLAVVAHQTVWKTVAQCSRGGGWTGTVVRPPPRTTQPWQQNNFSQTTKSFPQSVEKPAADVWRSGRASPGPAA